VHTAVPKYGAVILLGRLNANIGKEISNQEVAGKYKLHGVTRGNGQKLIQFAQLHDMSA
jgi:hypothetical protein